MIIPNFLLGVSYATGRYEIPLMKLFVGRCVSWWKHAHKPSIPRYFRNYSSEARYHSTWPPNTNGHFNSLKTFFFNGIKAPSGPGPLFIEASQSHSFRNTTLARTLLDEYQPDAQTSTWHTTITQANIHCPGGIRTHNPSKQAAEDRRLRPRGQWDQPLNTYQNKNYYTIMERNKTNILCCRPTSL